MPIRFTLPPILLLILLTSSFAAELPKEVRDLSKTIPCGDVSKFYDRPGTVTPPYLYGYLPGPRRNSIAFWCQANSKYYLVTAAKVRDKSNDCPHHFEWWNFPGGLSLSNEKHIPLDQFAHVRTPQKKGPAGRVTNYAPLRDYYDGVETLFYCYDGDWLYRIRD